jgi:tetratricopeptide (TPR) repeat protein
MSTAIALQHNPYIIGRPIHEKAEFFGRDDLFRFIADNLNQQAQVILLHGQRRIGKSSVLAQIPNFVELDDFEFVSLSLEGQANKDLGDLLSELARDIVDQLEHGGSLVKPMKAPAKSAFKKDISAFSETFLPKVYAALSDKNLVLLLDEFDVLEDHSPESAVEQFFPYLQSILKRHPKLYLVPVVGRRLDELPNLLNLFGRAPYQEVGLLQGKWARDLVTKPAAGMLNYAPEAIDAVLELTAGHPYLTQVLCFAVFVHLREEERRDVSRADVEGCVDKAIELGQAGLTWFRDGLPISERVMLSAVAAAQSRWIPESSPINDFGLLERHGVVLTKELRLAKTNLLNWGLIENDQQNIFRVKIELVQIWLMRKYSLKSEILDLEKTSEEAREIYSETKVLKQSIDNSENLLKNARQKQKQHTPTTTEYHSLSDSIKALEKDLKEVTHKSQKIYQEVLEVNPNYFSALFDLTEISSRQYLTIRKTEELPSNTMEMYERIYKIDPVMSEPGFLKILLKSVKAQILKGNFDDAQKTFERIISIDPDNDEIIELVSKIQDNYILEGKFFSFIRHLRKVIEISDSDEQKIKIMFNNWRIKSNNIRKYEDFVNSTVNKLNPNLEEEDLLSEFDHLYLRYGLRESDVSPIHRKARLLIEKRKNNARSQYQKEVKRLAREGWISSVARRILTRQASELGIDENSAYEIEEQVLSPYRNIQEYEQAFTEACSENYPLKERTRDELRELQKILRLSPSKVQHIETKVLEDLSNLASEVQVMISNVSNNYSYSSESPEGQTAIINQVITEIEKTPSLKERLIAAMAQGGSVAFEQAMNGSVGNIVVAGLKGWIEGNSKAVGNIHNQP